MNQSSKPDYDYVYARLCAFCKINHYLDFGKSFGSLVVGSAKLNPTYVSVCMKSIFISRFLYMFGFYVFDSK